MPFVIKYVSLNFSMDCTNLPTLLVCDCRLDIDSCEAEYLKDTYSAHLPECTVAVELYD